MFVAILITFLLIPTTIPVEVDFAVGDSAVIVSGPFESAQGIISAINMHKQSVTVNIEMLGRETPVEINFTEVRVEQF